MTGRLTEDSTFTVTLRYGTLIEATRALRAQARRLDDLVKSVGDITYSQAVTLPLRLQADELRRDARLIEDATVRAGVPAMTGLALLLIGIVLLTLGLARRPI